MIDIERISKHECKECGWKPEAGAEYPEDRLIEHYEEKHDTQM